MPLGVLNNISAVYAENNLNRTQSSLQNVLTQLSSGSKINSGADDPAGLSIANGLAANSAALAQSSSNASEGAGFLQVADGALSQVTSLLTSAVTLATEAGGGTLSSAQMGAANQEYQDILTQIGTIGSTTEYNGITVFSSDQTRSALGWGVGAAGTATSATGTAAKIESSAIVKGGTTAGTAPTLVQTYGTARGVAWASGGDGTTLTAMVTPGDELSGTLAFSPTWSSGSPTGISVDLSQLDNSSQANLVSSLQASLDQQASGDYTVTGGSNNQIIIGIAGSPTDAVTAIGDDTSANSEEAAQTGFTMAVAAGDSLSGTLVVTPATGSAGGAPANVNFDGSGTSSITANIGSGSLLSGSVTITGNIPQSGGDTSQLDWSGTGSTVVSADITPGSTLSGSFTIVQVNAGDFQIGNNLVISLDDVNPDGSNLVSTIQSQITSGGGDISDYNIGYSSGVLSIGINGTPADGLTKLEVGYTEGQSATQTTPIVPASTTAPMVIDLEDVSAANLQSTLNTDLAGSDFTGTYDSGSGSLQIGISNAGTTDGVSTLSLGAHNVQQATPAQTDSGQPVNIDLTGVTSANLQSTVDSALNQGSQTPDYAVGYLNGLLSVTLDDPQAATDKITGLSVATSGGAITQTSANAATIAYTSGDTLGGKFTITSTVNGTVGNPISVDLTGLNTSDAVVSAVNKALGSAAADYTVGYSTTSGTDKLSIAVSAQGLKDGVNSITIANGSSTDALMQGTAAASNIAIANTDMGSFTLTPTGTGINTPLTVSLTGLSPTGTGNAELQAGIQKALGNNYIVSYDSTSDSNSGNLNIAVSSTGVAAGVTGFTVAEASQAAASEETPVSGGVNIYTSDGTSTGSQNYNVTVGTLSASGVGTSSSTSNMGSNITASVGGVTGTGGVQSGAGAGTSLTGTSLGTQADAEAALETVDDAINAVAYQRGQVGANINTLTAASSIASAQMTNITSAQNTITATDYAAATSNMSKYEILTQTGISALAQANSTQQMVTKLLQ